MSNEDPKPLEEINDKALLEKYGITTEQKTVYLYKKYKYDNAKDALNFAKIEMDREEKSIS